MSIKAKFFSIVSQYCNVCSDDLKGSARFREDLDFSSLDFMSFLGEVEDEFDVELEQEQVLQIRTVDEALSLIEELQEA